MDRMDFKTVFKIGRSLAITLPLHYCGENSIKSKTRLLVTEFDNKIVIETLNAATVEKLEQIGFASKLPKEIQK